MITIETKDNGFGFVFVFPLAEEEKEENQKATWRIIEDPPS